MTTKTLGTLANYNVIALAIVVFLAASGEQSLSIFFAVLGCIGLLPIVGKLQPDERIILYVLNFIFLYLVAYLTYFFPPVGIFLWFLWFLWRWTQNNRV